MADAPPVDPAQAFFNATAAAQLAILPHFSNNVKDDNYTPSQWLDKVLSHKEAGHWTDEQTIAHVRNAFRGNQVLKWFSSLQVLGIDIKVWANIQTAFQKDFKAAPTTTSVVFKIAD